MIRRVFFGHRGVGKTSLLERHHGYFPAIPHFDLDQEIEKSEGLTVAQIFANKGESCFRQIELQLFNRLVQENTEFVIAVGGGFPVDKITEPFEKIWVARTTDQEGRLFLNRPRLEADVSALQEYKNRFQKRQPLFQKHNTWIYHLPEGLRFSKVAQKYEQNIFSANNEWDIAYLTIPSVSFTESQYGSRFKKIEVREDLVSFNDYIQFSLDSSAKGSSNPVEILFSLRTGNFSDWSALACFIKSTAAEVQIDIDQSLIDRFMQNAQGAAVKPSIISSHVDDLELNLNSLKEASLKWTHQNVHLKCCPLVETWDQFIKGDQWMSEDPKNRSFLPRSKDGRWLWYRLLKSKTMKLNFIRSTFESLDQPSLFQLMSVDHHELKAAVLGSPVSFSYSPLFHLDYFDERKMTMSFIHVEEADFSKAFKWLTENGFQYFSVTSPLKREAYKVSEANNKTDQNFQSINTLYVDSKTDQLLGQNTDFIGFQKTIEDLLKSTGGPSAAPDQAVIDLHEVQWVIWGGLGTLPILQKALPHAFCFSSRTGEIKTEKSPSNTFKQKRPIYLVWAAPQADEFIKPPTDWNIQCIVDLNYRDNSSGLALACDLQQEKKNVEYISGLSMFRYQGLAQQEFWSQHERK